MERESQPEKSEVRGNYHKLYFQISETRPDMPLTVNMLDELLTYGVEEFQQEAHKSGEFHEEAAMAYKSHFTARHGSYYKEKLQFCENLARENLKLATLAHIEMENEELVQGYRLAASNWYRMAAICLVVPESAKQVE